MTGKASSSAPRLAPADLRKFVKDSASAHPLPDGYAFDMAAMDDLDELVRLGSACFASDTPKRAELRYFLTRAHCVFLVIRRADRQGLAGYILLEANRRTRMMYDNTVCIDPEDRGKGLGQAFYSLKRRALETLGYKAMTAHVAAGNQKALYLMHKYGFRPVERISGYYEDGADAFKLRMDAP